MKSFLFQNPLMLLFLVLVIPIYLTARYAYKRRQAIMQEIDEAENTMGSTRVRDLGRLVALILLILALARPGINPQRKSVSQSGRDVVFVLDVSRSMLAEDVLPNRLEVAKEGIRDALNSFSSERVSLVVYAGSANILCPLTYDYNFVRYMLDQATTRAVDFGGTTLLSAVQKCVDNVLVEDREDMHDLIVLTDGEEHSETSNQIAELLESKGAGLLLIGVGDDSVGARIPILDEEGKGTYLKFEGDYVTTKLRSAELARLVGGIDQATYRDVGTRNFDLPSYYYDYVSDKPVSGSVGDESFVVYQEAGFPLMWLAIMLFIFAEGRFRFFHKKWLLPIFVIVQIGLVAAEESLDQEYRSASSHQQAGRLSEALDSYSAILENNTLSNQQTAAVVFNQGLCYLAQSKSEADSQPETALVFAQQAQSRFLLARQLNPSFDRPSQRLDPTSKLIASYQAQIAELQKQEQELEEEMQRLVERLQALHKSQSELLNAIPNRKRRNPVMPKTADSDSRSFQQRQQKLNTEAVSINLQLIAIDKKFSSPEQPAVLAEPRNLMNHAMAAQTRSYQTLKQWASWPEAKSDQSIALGKIQEIIDMLSQGSLGDSDDDNWEDEEDWDDSEYSDSDESSASSIDAKGDFAGSSEMQALPTPNYSVQDVLQQEQGSLQFRQQQRAANNKGKIEKDW